MSSMPYEGLRGLSTGLIDRVKDAVKNIAAKPSHEGIASHTMPEKQLHHLCHQKIPVSWSGDS